MGAHPSARTAKDSQDGNKKANRQLRPSCALCVADVLDKYLEWCQKHRAQRTYEWYRDHFRDFKEHSPKVAALPVTRLKAFHIVEWADAHEGWGSAYYRGAVIALQRPFNWAAKLGYIKGSPVREIEKPRAPRRELFITPTVWQEMKAHYRDGDPFRDLLEFAWDTGCRPQEVKRIERRHVNIERRQVIFPPEEAKGKRWRIIRLPARAWEIIQRHLGKEGVLFRNEDGRPWTKSAMSCRFARLKKHMGGVKFCGYALRHGFCQDLLEQGNDPLAVAELMGHANARMVCEVYSHMKKAEPHLDKILQNRKS
jgi:integrase